MLLGGYMDLNEVNDLLRSISEKSTEERIKDYIDMLEEEEMMHYEHDMQMYACHSYDQDAIAYGTMF